MKHFTETDFQREFVASVREQLPTAWLDVRDDTQRYKMRGSGNKPFDLQVGIHGRFFALELKFSRNKRSFSKSIVEAHQLKHLTLFQMVGGFSWVVVFRLDGSAHFVKIKKFVDIPGRSITFDQIQEKTLPCVMTEKGPRWNVRSFFT